MAVSPAVVVSGPWSAGFVGRVDEVAVLRDLVGEVAAGRGGSVLVEGEPGIGKSALLAVGLSDVVELGCRVFRCTGDVSGERLPLRALADGLGVDLDELLPDVVRAGLGAGVDPVPAMVRGLLERVDRLCAVAPTVLVLDDLHNADEASLLVWSRLSRSLAQLPLLLAAAARPGSRRVEVAMLRRALLAGGTVGLSLAPLPESQVVEQVGGLVGARVGPGLRRLAAGAGGNPLFVREAVDAQRRAGGIRVERGVADLVDGGATVAPVMSLAAAIEGRLRSLPAETLPLVRLAALLGGEFAVVDLATVAGRPVTGVVAVVEQAVAGGVLVESGARLAFRHPLLRQALSDAVPAADRAVLHGRAARALAEAGAPAERVAQLLLASASPVEEWVPDWLDGALAILMLRAPKLAAELTERVLDRVPGGDPRRERLGADLVTVLRLLARYADVERVGRSLLAEVTDPVCAGQIAWTLAYALMSSGRSAEGTEVVEAALRRWPGVVPWAARLRGLLALLILGAGGQVDVAVETAERAVAEGERTGDRFAVGFGLHVLSLMKVPTSAALAHIDRALTVVADHLEGADLRLLLSSNKALDLRHLGRPAEAERTLREALTLAERTGTPRQLTLRSVAAVIYYRLGRWDDALVELEIAQELRSYAPVADYEVVQTHGVAALIAGHRDDRAALDSHLAIVEGVSPEKRKRHDDHFRLARALVAERAGEFGVALDVLVSSVRSDESGMDRGRPRILPVVVRLALTAGNPDIARWATDLCDREADIDPRPFASAAARRCHGLLDASVADLRAAVDGYRAIGDVVTLAGGLEDLAVVHGQRGEVQAARTAYAEAVELYQGLGAACDLARARSRVQPYDIGAGPHSAVRPTSGWFALTPTERRIAYLVADGLSNPDIAAERFLSRRTVQSHVSHILTKLDARSRAEIAEEAARHPDGIG